MFRIKINRVCIISKIAFKPAATLVTKFLVKRSHGQKKYCIAPVQLLVEHSCAEKLDIETVY